MGGSKEAKGPMRAHCERSVKILMIVALVMAASTEVRAASQEDVKTRTEAVGSLRPAPPGLTADNVIAKLLDHNRLQTARLRQYSAVRKYEVRNAKGELTAEAIVRVEFRAPSTKTFQKISEKGPWVVRHLVFDRLISAETETASGREHHDSAIAPANYRFTLLGSEDLGPYHCFVVEAAPKRRDKYLFDGKIWIDAQDSAVVRIEGHPAKSLSFWIRRVDFVRQYQKIDGFWLPRRDETFVDVRIYGKRIFTVDHQGYSIGDGGTDGKNTQLSRTAMALQARSKQGVPQGPTAILREKRLRSTLSKSSP
jgi:hypothetical protein